MRPVLSLIFVDNTSDYPELCAGHRAQPDDRLGSCVLLVNDSDEQPP